MLDLFTIFTKGGIVLWCFQGTGFSLSPAVNALIKTVILQERGAVTSFEHERLMLKFCMDNEFELVFVVAYQKVLGLAYVDKLLQQVHLEFRDRFKNELTKGPYIRMNFSADFERIHHSIEDEARRQSSQPRIMRPFSKDGGKAAEQAAAKPLPDLIVSGSDSSTGTDVQPSSEGVGGEGVKSEGSPRAGGRGILGPASEKVGGQRRRGKQTPAAKKNAVPSSKFSPKVIKRTKESRKWENGGSKKDVVDLDHSKPAAVGEEGIPREEEELILPDYDLSDGLKVLKPFNGGEEDEEEEEEEEEDSEGASSGGKASGGGVFAFFKKLTGGKTITREGMASVLEHMKEHLISKNVAVAIAEQLCESVATKLDGKVIGTFSGIQSTVRGSLEESLVQILSPKRRVDVLRDVMDARSEGQPFVITFCGVNGVGKSTNLAKIAFWLLENGLRVIIAACDTFRSGAVEQLRTHARRLNHHYPAEREGGPERLLLYERGYGKDAAGIAMEAIHCARQQRYDCVLVDTAGRMQDNEPLMKALAKLIRVNSPDLVLFVGEALVGNEAVDQLVKFNRALVDHSDEGSPHVIDGILLTKFDTIDDKVGAALSMTYITGQPIVFVGTGQTYTDLKTLNVQAVVSALLK